MEILIKKTKGGKNVASVQELEKLMALASIKKQNRELKNSLEKIKEELKVDKEEVLKSLSGEVLRKGEVLNISHAASIEKLKSVPNGTVYYNKTLDAIRLRTQKGWVTLKTE